MLSTVALRRTGRQNPVGSYLEERSGVAAVEFALIVPLMMMMFIGTVELCQAITANRHVGQVASTVGDLVARSTSSITTANIVDDMTSATYLLAPFPSASATVTVTMVQSSSSNANNTVVAWSCQYVGTNTTSVSCNGGSNACYTNNFPSITIPTGLVTTQDYVVMTTITYAYKPPLFDVFMKTGYGNETNGTYTMTSTVYEKPRGTVPMVVLGGTTCTPDAF
jgi:Flp pilus assembly protein TadG